jgi:hypothetical protein
MGENIDPTWVACAGREPLDPREVSARMARVERHYASLVDYPLRVSAATSGHCAIAVAGDAEPRCRWEHFVQDGELAVATAYVPGGWSRLARGELSEAPLALARRTLREPGAVIASLTPPVALAVLDRASGELVVINDAIGAARAFTLTAGELTVWSNRPGALAIFAGVRPAADEEGWQVQAGAGWPLGSTSPIAGVTRLEPGMLCTADARGVVTGEPTHAARSLVDSGSSWRELAGPAAEAMVSQAQEVAALWPEAASVDLSGGRDSRVTAAAAIAAGIDARFLTSNATPGEGRVARELMELAGGDHEHQIRRRKKGSATPGTPLLERAANLHLLHDGVRHAQKLRGKMTLPRPRPSGAKLSGHGGEIAHGFFYSSRAEIWRLRLRPGALRDRLDRFFAHGHAGIRAEASQAARREVDRTLEEGREYGLRGPSLLDWFYLVDRFAHRSGLATDSERSVLFATPAAVAAAFAMSPRQRVDGELHRWLTGRFVPAWAGVPYFQATKRRVARSKRERLWQVEADAAVVEEVLAAGGPWAELYDRDEAVREWRALRSGEGNRKAEALFEGIVYRASFDDHLERLAKSATGAV